MWGDAGIRWEGFQVCGYCLWHPWPVNMPFLPVLINPFCPPHVHQCPPLSPLVSSLSAHRDDLAFLLVSLSPHLSPTCSSKYYPAIVLCRSFFLLVQQTLPCCNLCWMWMLIVWRINLLCTVCTPPKKINWAFAIHAWGVKTDSTADLSQTVSPLTLIQPCWRWAHICMQWSTKNSPLFTTSFFQQPVLSSGKGHSTRNVQDSHHLHALTLPCPHESL